MRSSAAYFSLSKVTLVQGKANERSISTIRLAPAVSELAILDAKPVDRRACVVGSNRAPKHPASSG
jgi:hypothetical protein